MDSCQFLKKTRLTKKQMQLRQQQNQRYILNSPHGNYKQVQCQHFTPDKAQTSTHFPPPLEYPAHHHLNQYHTFQKSNPNSIKICSDYENQHDNQVELVSDKDSHST